MTERFIQLTRAGGGETVIVNTDNIAWIMPGVNGTTHIVFAVGLPREGASGSPLALDVQESMDEVGRLLGGTIAQAREALKQAFDKINR